MLSELIKYALSVKNLYRLGIDNDLNSYSFFKAKFESDRAKEKVICFNLYKKLK